MIRAEARIQGNHIPWVLFAMFEARIFPLMTTIGDTATSRVNLLIDTCIMTSTDLIILYISISRLSCAYRRFLAYLSLPLSIDTHLPKNLKNSRPSYPSRVGRPSGLFFPSLSAYVIERELATIRYDVHIILGPLSQAG